MVLGVNGSGSSSLVFQFNKPLTISMHAFTCVSNTGSDCIEGMILSVMRQDKTLSSQESILQVSLTEQITRIKTVHLKNILQSMHVCTCMCVHTSRSMKPLEQEFAEGHRIIKNTAKIT